MKRRLVLVAIITLVSQILLVAAPKPKEKEIFLSPVVYYKGYVVKKSPCGEGTLAMYYHKDVSKMDLIYGEFRGGTVENATLLFSHGGPIFMGDLSYEIKNDRIEYTLISGTLKGEYARTDFRSAKFSITIKEPVIISRSFSSFELSPTTFSTITRVKAREYKSIDPDVPYSGPTLLQRAYYLAETLEKSYGITQTYPLEVTLSGINDVRGIDGYYSCNRFDLPNGTYIEEVNQGYQLKNSANAFSLNPDSVSLKKVFKDGVIQYDSHVIFDFKNFATQSEAILKQISEYLTEENQAILSEIKHLPESKNSRMPTSFLKVECSDGRVFYGELRPQGLKSYGPTATIDYILASTSVDSCLQQDIFSDGVLIYPDGRQELYVNCHTGAELVKYKQEQIRQKNLRFASLKHGINVPLKGNIESLYVYMGYSFTANFNESGQMLEYSTGEGGASSTTRYFFKSNGQIDYAIIREEDDAEGTASTFKDVYYYDDNGNVCKVESYVSGRMVSYQIYTYDSMDNCIEIEAFEGQRSCSTKSFSYDNKGNLIKAIDVNGEVTTYSYDSLGRLIREESSYSIIKYSHDSKGNVVEAEVYEAYSGEQVSGGQYSYTYWG